MPDNRYIYSVGIASATTQTSGEPGGTIRWGDMAERGIYRAYRDGGGGFYPWVLSILHQCMVAVRFPVWLPALNSRV